MHEAQTEITKILMLVHQRMDKVMTLKIAMKDRLEEKNIDKVVKKLYVDVVRLSSRIFIGIQTLKDNEKALQRPFIFSRNQYDEDWMHKQMKKLRVKIIETVPNLKDANELKMFLCKSGDISDVRKMNKEEYELDSEEAESTSSSEEAAESVERFDQSSI